MPFFNSDISKDDFAHGWIPFVVLVLLALVIRFSEALLLKLNLTVLVLYISAIIFLFLLQFFNELFQYFDTDRDKKYGSRKRFLQNSKKDWALFLLGLFLGSIVFILLLSFF